MNSFREAIECLKRALIGADPHEITIHLKLAKLHYSLEEFPEAAAYNRRVVEVCQADCKPPLIFVHHGASHHPNIGQPLVRPIQDYAKSSIHVAIYHMKLDNGDLLLAQDYLERVAASNAEEVTQATELLKRVRHMIQERIQAKGQDVQGSAVSEGDRAGSMDEMIKMTAR